MLGLFDEVHVAYNSFELLSGYLIFNLLLRFIHLVIYVVFEFIEDYCFQIILLIGNFVWFVHCFMPVNSWNNWLLKWPLSNIEKIGNNWIVGKWVIRHGKGSLRLWFYWFPRSTVIAWSANSCWLGIDIISTITLRMPYIMVSTAVTGLYGFWFC